MDDRPRLIAATMAVFLLLFARGMTRFHDLDEHQFVAPPALLAQQGQLPYADYPYFHMPTLVYLTAPLMAWCPWPLLVGRLVSVACGTATVLLLFLHGWRLLREMSPSSRWLLAGGPCLIFLTSRLFTYTNGRAWNHDPSVLCMLAALLLHLRGLKTGRVVPFAWAGLLFGLAVGIRLSFALCFVPLAASLLLSQSPLSRRGRVLALSLATFAAFVVLSPAMVSMARHPEAFFFGNLSFARWSTAWYALDDHNAISLTGKLVHLLQTFLTDPGNAFLLLGACVAVALAWRDSAARVILATLPFLLVGAWGPSPAQYQYYYMLLPFLVLLIPHGIAASNVLPWRRAVWAGVAVAVVVGLPRWYWQVVTLASPSAWVPVRVHRTGEWVRSLTPGRVLTIDPGVPLEAGLEVYAEFATGRFPSHVGPLMSPEERRRHRIAWGEEFDRLVSARPPSAVLVLAKPFDTMPPELRDYAERHGFERHRSPDGEYELWVLREAE